MGPLDGVHVVEFGGLGPGPLAGMILADLGAAVTVIERPDHRRTAGLGGVGANLLNRGKRSVVLDLKSPEGTGLALRLVARADALIEGNRPGVMERVGLGPEACAARNPRLVYGRMTGWGQEGPLAGAAGHDLNYVALTGILALSARDGAPVIPPTMVGDAPGGLALAFGIVCAVLEARRSGRGQVVDAAIVDVTAYLGGQLHWMRAMGTLPPEGPGLLQGDAPFYEAYACADGRFITLAALEPAFYRVLVEKLGLDDLDPAAQYDLAAWPALKTRVAALIRRRTQAEWCALLEGTDACFAPVLDLDAAAEHPHLRARGTYLRVDGVLQAAPAPRFSRSHPEPVPPPAIPGAHADALLAELGLSDAEIAALRQRGVVG